LMQFEPKPGGAPVEVAHGGPDRIPSICNLTFLVDDLDATLAKLDAYYDGLPSDPKPQAASPPFDIDLPKSGRATIVFVRDPEGNLIEIAQRKKQAPAPDE